MVKLLCCANLPKRAEHPTAFLHYLLMASRGEGGRNKWRRVVTYQLLLKSVNWQMKPRDLWAISKRKKITTTIWEVGRRYHLAKMFQKTQKHIQTHQCVHTHTHTETQCPQADATGKPSLLLNLFPSLLLKGRSESQWVTEEPDSIDSPTADSLRLQTNHLLWI